MKKMLLLMLFFVAVMPKNVSSMEGVLKERETPTQASLRKSNCDQVLDEETSEAPVFLQRCRTLKVYNWFGPANKRRIKVVSKIVFYCIVISYLYNNYSVFYRAFFPLKEGDL